MKRNTRIGLIVISVLIVVTLAYLVGRRSKELVVASPSPSVQVIVTATPVTQPTATPTPGVPRCHTADLGLTVGQSNGAAGTTYIAVSLTNKSTVTCTVFGYPGVSLLDAAGTQLGQPATRSSTVTSAKITLAPGKSAHSNLGFPSAGNFDPGACSAASTTLRLFPPDETTALTAPLAAQNCPGFSVTALAAGAE